MSRALGRARGWSTGFVDVRAEERGVVALAFVYFAAVMTGWYSLRPLREDASSAVPTSERKYLYTATFIGSLVVVPLFSWLVSRYDRRKLLPWLYEFFCLCLLGFWAAGQVESWSGSVDRVFFVWSSVYSLFVVSVFWSVMVDVFDDQQGKRLFGLISAGGSMGTLLGSELPKQLYQAIGRGGMFLVAAGLLQVCVLCVWLVRRGGSGARSRATATRGGTGGSAWAGFVLTLKRPYLRGLAFQTLCITIGSTFLYNQKVEIVGQLYTDRAARTAVYAQIDQVTNLATLLGQGLLTAVVLKRLGLRFALGFLPALGALGFAALAILQNADALTQLFYAVIGFEALRRVSHHALEKPSREVLFTVVTREEKYKAKDFLDVAVYRGGDMAGGWIYDGLLQLGRAVPAWFAVPLSGIAFGVSQYLGRAQQRLAKSSAENDGDAAPR